MCRKCPWPSIGYRADEQLPPALTTVTDVEVVVFERPLTIRVPDVIVTRTVVYSTNPPRYVSSDVLVALEILSDGTRRGRPHGEVRRVRRVRRGRHPAVLDRRPRLPTLDVAGHPVILDLDALTSR